MTKTFTENDLVRYVYGETDEVENIEIESALLCDSEVQEQYIQLSEVKARLNVAEYSPSDFCVKSILEAAKKLTLQSVTN